jgi:hypothetical protein
LSEVFTWVVLRGIFPQNFREQILIHIRSLSSSNGSATVYADRGGILSLYENCWILLLMIEFISCEACLNDQSNCLRRLIGRPAFVLILSLFTGIATCSWAQQIQPHVSNPANAAFADLELPDAPLAQGPSPSTVQPVTAASQIGDAHTGSEAGLGTVHGVVVDRDQAVYEGVQVILTQAGSAGLALAPERSVTTDSNGRFTFANVPPGAFEITASSSGFTTQKISGVVHPGENYAVPDIVLPVSTTTSEVQVTASRFEVAQEQLKEEEQQRVFGAIPNFYVVYAPNAPPLNSRQKFNLAWRSSIDPFSFLASAGAAGIEQADDQFKGYGQGTKGYAKRFGANYADDFLGNMIGGAILPSLLKQDPRYFYKGTGTIRSRSLYAIANAVICKGDNGHWQFNYSGIVGSLASAGISNIYYPASDRNGFSLTIENTLTGIGFSAVGNLFQEFLVRKLTPKVPNYGASKP